MWASLARGGLGLAVLTFLMWALRETLDLIVGEATAGSYGDPATVQRVAGYFSAMTLENLTLLAALAVGTYVLGRAAVERQLG